MPEPPYVAEAGPSNYAAPYLAYPSMSIAPSLLTSHTDSTGTPSITPDLVDGQLHHSPAEINPETPHDSPILRSLSVDSAMEHSHDDQDEAEGVEKDGMIWGMKVGDYRSLSARERKRVRNRISARTFRAKRKGELLMHRLHPTLD
jgi:hypothetical protein